MSNKIFFLLLFNLSLIPGYSQGSQTKAKVIIDSIEKKPEVKSYNVKAVSKVRIELPAFSYTKGSLIIKKIELEYCYRNLNQKQQQQQQNTKTKTKLFTPKYTTSKNVKEPQYVLVNNIVVIEFQPSQFTNCLKHTVWIRVYYTDSYMLKAGSIRKLFSFYVSD